MADCVGWWFVLRSGILLFQGSVNGTTFVHELPLASVANGRHCGMVICADQWHFVSRETKCIHKLPLASVANSRHCGMVNSTDWWHFAFSGECNVEWHAPASCCVLPAVPDSTDRRCPGHLVCPTHTGPRKAVRLAVQKQLLPHQSEWLVLIFPSPLPVSFHTPLSKLFLLLPPPPFFPSILMVMLFKHLTPTSPTPPATPLYSTKLPHTVLLLLPPLPPPTPSHGL